MTTPMAARRPVLRSALLLGLLGAVLGPVLDYAHVVTGAIRYPIGNLGRWLCRDEELGDPKARS